MKILVAGASGFVGRNFLLQCPSSWDVTGIYHTSTDFPEFLEKNNLTHVKPTRCNLQNERDVRNTFDQLNKEYEVCLYTAGNSDIGLSIQDPILDLDSNVVGLTHLLKKIQVKKIVYMSTGAVYLGHQGLVSTETSVNPTIPYGISKLCCELYIKYFQEHTNHVQEYVNLRFFGAYGPMELPRKIYTNLIKTFHVNDENTFSVRGGGENLIDAMYIDDTVEGLMKVIESDQVNLTLDFCNGQPLTINELITRVGKILGKERITINHEGATSEPIRFRASPDKMKEFYDFIPSIPLEEGMLKFTKFFEQTYCQT